MAGDSHAERGTNAPDAEELEERLLRFRSLSRATRMLFGDLDLQDHEEVDADLLARLPPERGVKRPD